MLSGDLVGLLKSAGYLGMFLSILLENSIIFLFFMPSDSLLFAAGLLCALGYFDLYTTMAVCFIGSVLGYALGYYLGYKAGPKIFKEDNQKLMTLKHLHHAKEFYNKYASLALIFARFFPIRAFVSAMAGASHVDYRLFTLYNIIGGAIWSVGIILIGYFLGKFITPEELHFVFGGIFVIFLLVVFTVPFTVRFLQKRYGMDNENK